MAQIALKFSFAPGDLASGMPAWVIGDIRAAIASAGFTVLPEPTDPDMIDFMQAGSTGADQTDDTPHWCLMMNPGVCLAYAVHGPSYDSATRKTYPVAVSWGEQTYYDEVAEDTVVSPVELYFSCDGAAGTWWMAIMARGMTGAPELAVKNKLVGVVAGARSRRYPADMGQGVVARYGLVSNNGGDFMFPYAKTGDGSSETNSASGKLWSPLGSPWSSTNFTRYEDQPMAPVFAPAFAFISASGAPPAYLGELEGIFLATDGFSHESEPAPGLVAMSWDLPTGAPLHRFVFAKPSDWIEMVEP